MPSWTEIGREIVAARQAQPARSPFDVVRRKYLAALAEHTGHATLVYATRFTQPGVAVPPELTGFADEDVPGVHEVTEGLEGPVLDLVLHAPGGSLAATEAIVRRLRDRFERLRVIVPHQIRGAATVLACAADELVLGSQSWVGAIESTVVVHGPAGSRLASAHAILAQLERAKRECREDPRNAAAWAPVLAPLGPDLVACCEREIRTARELAASWLEKHALRGQADARDRADNVARWLAEQASQHPGRPLEAEALAKQGLRVTRLEDDPRLAELVQAVFHSVSYALTDSPAVKIVESHLGRAFIKSLVVAPAGRAMAGSPAAPAPKMTPVPAPPGPKEQQ